MPRPNRLSLATGGIITAAVLALGQGGASRQTGEKHQGRIQAAVAEKALSDQRADQAPALIEQHRVQERLVEDDTAYALAMLAKTLRLNPTNRMAADRLFSVLSQRAFVLPNAKTLETNLPYLFSPPSFSFDGRHV